DPSAVILDFYGDAAIVGVADVRNIPSVARARADLPVDSVVEIVAEIVAYEALEACAGLLCGLSVSCHLSDSFRSPGAFCELSVSLFLSCPASLLGFGLTFGGVVVAL